MKRGLIAVCFLLISCVFPMSQPSSEMTTKLSKTVLPPVTVYATRTEHFPAIQNPCGFDYSGESAELELLGKLDCAIELRSSL